MRKKILYVHYGDDWIRGSEKCLLDLIKYIERRYDTFVWTNNRELAKQLDVMSVENELSSFPLLLSWKAPKYDLSSWYKLVAHGCELIEREQIDLIHVNSGAPCQWMLAAARIKHIPLVTQLHCPYPARDRMTLGLHLSPHTIAVSHHVADALIEDGYPSNKMSVIHNGIDTRALAAQAAIDVRAELGIDEHDFIFVTVGSLIQRKGIDRILTALRHVSLEYPNVHLVVVGDGPLRAKLEQQVDYLHLSAQVHFVGEKTNVVGWMKGCDAFVSGARSEAFGLVVAEAAMAKLPIIAPFEGGIPEFIKHGKTGILYPNSGVAPLAKAMRIVVNNPHLCIALSEHAYAYIKQNHDLSIALEQVERVYAKLISEQYHAPRSLINTLAPIKTYVAHRFSLGGQHG